MIKGFIKSDKVYSVLNTGYKSSQNVVLYGPGGYGKSEMSIQFLKQIGARTEQIMVKSLSVGTSTDDLFGGINMKVLQEQGKIEYNLEDSIFSKPFLILEEAFDAPLRVLESLKDVLTSGYVRNGSQVYKVQTKFIIVCTNRSKSELVEDQSSAALMERFPLSLEVKWSSNNIEDYKMMIDMVFGETPEVITDILNYMLESIKKDSSKTPPSPRTVVRMVKIFYATGIEGLVFMDGLPNIDRAIEHVCSKQAEKIYRENFEKEVEDLRTLKRHINESTPYKTVLEFNKKVKKDLEQYSEYIEDSEISYYIKNLTV